jgi:hypothetical protein
MRRHFGCGRFAAHNAFLVEGTRLGLGQPPDLTTCWRLDCRITGMDRKERHCVPGIGGREIAGCADRVLSHRIVGSKRRSCIKEFHENPDLKIDL